MRYTTPANLCDSYKVGHRAMYPAGMTGLQSNWTARGSRVPGADKVVFFGLQAFLQKFLMEYFQEDFFNVARDFVVSRHQDRVEGLLQQPFDASHWVALHRLGYLPLRFSALPEGTEVPLRVPMFLVENTHDDFAWLVNYIESVMSAEIWLPTTSATMALRFRRMLDGWAQRTSDTPEAVDWQGHDFSFRGMGSLDAASASGAGHLLAFAGSDMLTAMDWADHYYGIDGALVRFVGGSVPASEHSVMCAGLQGGEEETFRTLLERFPGGILSVVSDTWNLWDVITKILPRLKGEILARKGGPGGPESPGKLVIRPDSGNPCLILAGDPAAAEGTPVRKGVIELLWDVFGGTVNSKGFKVLDPHIGAIYGDAITYDRADAICRMLSEKGFASTNVVLGIGSFSYQYVTRDTFSMAMKATWCAINGEGRAIEKRPVTDTGMKASARGRLACRRNDEGKLVLINDATPEDEAASLYAVVWENGRFVRRYSFREVAERVGVRVVMPQ